jgi:hypothetical protein
MTDESQRPTKTVTIAHEDLDTIEDGIESLRQIPGMGIWESEPASTRTTVIENGETDEIHVEGIGDNDTGPQRLAIDYGTDPPRVIVHGDPEDEEPTDVVSLEHATNDGSSGNTDQ